MLALSLAEQMETFYFYMHTNNIKHFIWSFLQLAEVIGNIYCT